MSYRKLKLGKDARERISRIFAQVPYTIQDFRTGQVDPNFSMPLNNPNVSPNIDEEIAKHTALLEVLKAKKKAQEPSISKPDISNALSRMEVNE